jgi:tetratricopeptide (TPR) repeat protein
MPNLYDCYYGLGSYHYWRTAKSKFIRTIAFWMKDKRKLGLEQLQFAIVYGRYCPWETTHGLIIAYFDNGDYNKALALNDTVIKLNDLPSVGALYMRGRLMAHFERWGEVQDIYQKILNRIIAQPYQSVGYRVECRYWIAEALYAQNQLDKAYELTTSALAQSKERNKDDELENAIDNFDDIKKWLGKLHENLRKE